MGKVAGSFYLIVLDGQPSRFTAAMARAAALYAASTVLYAVSSWVTGELLPLFTYSPTCLLGVLFGAAGCLGWAFRLAWLPFTTRSKF